MASADPAPWRGITIELAGRRVRILVDDPAWLAHLTHACGRYEAAGVAAARLYLAGDAAHLPDDARRLLALAGAAGDAAPPRVERIAGASVSVEARKSLAITPVLGVCWAHQPISSATSFYYNYFHPLLIEWLARSGVLYLHAGAAEHARTGPLLIVGPRHAGKTTTCLALLTVGGCRFLSDDTVLLDEHGDAHTLLRPMHPERRLCEAWSSRLGFDLDAVEPIADGRLDLDPVRWFTDRVVDRIDAPRTLILPWASGAAVTRGEPVGPEQAAAVVLAQIHAGVPPLDRAMLHRVAALLALPALRLHVGRDAFEDPARLWCALCDGLDRVR